MRAAIDTADRQFLERLRRIGSGTVQDLCDELGVTATAVRQRLVRLQALNLLKRETVRTGRGRPHHTYQLTDAGLRELSDNYAELAVILWRELRNIEDATVRNQLVERVRHAMVARYEPHVKSTILSERMQQLQVAMVERGFDVEVQTTRGLPILKENSCPYHELASYDPAICELEQSVFGALLGADVELTKCCLDGHAACEFHVAAK
jgi:predicted ArsR family transcriptional regulator